MKYILKTILFLVLIFSIGKANAQSRTNRNITAKSENLQNKTILITK